MESLLKDPHFRVDELGSFEVIKLRSAFLEERCVRSTFSLVSFLVFKETIYNSAHTRNKANERKDDRI